jgi:multiple sugar transport system ATP-binding protein
MMVDTGNFKVAIPASHVETYKNMDGKDVIFGIRPENIHDPEFAPQNINGEKISAKVDVTELMGNETLLYLLSGKNIFVGRVDPRSKLRVNDTPQVIFDMDKFHIFDASTEEAVR